MKLSAFTTLRSKVYYGWIMVATAIVVQSVMSGLLGQAFGAYVVLLQEDLDWSKASIAGAMSLMSLESGLLGPLGGWLVDRFGPRTTMRIGLSAFGIGLMLFSQVDSLPGFYFAFAIMAIGQSLGGFMPLTVAIVNWFQRRRATALATMQMGHPLGGLAVPLVVLSLTTLGWRPTAFLSGVILLAICLPLAQLIRHRPEDYGLEVDGGPARPNEAGSGSRSTPPSVDFSAREALRTRAFWLVSLGHGSALLVVSAGMVHLVPHLHERLGYSLEAAAFAVSLLAVMQILGQIVGGFLGDRFSKRLLVTVCMAMHAGGFLLLAHASALPFVVMFAVLHGLAWGIRAPLMQAIRADYFGRAAFGAIMGWSSLITTFGNTVGPLVAGIFADMTGTYTLGFTILGILAGLGSVFFILAVPPRPPARLAPAG